MDKELPSEIIAQIALNLPLKDLNSLLRVSKSTHWKLQRHRNMLKAKVTVHISRDTKFPERICFEVQRGKKTWTVKLDSKVSEPMENREGLSKEQKEFIVKTFYHEGSGTNNYFVDQREVISFHLQFLLSRVHIECITLGRVLDSDIEAITKEVNQSQAIFETVKLYSSHFKQCHQDLLVACNPQHFVVCGGCSFPDSFYQLRVVQKLHSLIDFSMGQNNIDIYSLAATKLEIMRLSNIDFSVIMQYLKEWMENRRKIKKFEAKVKMGIREQELNSLISLCKREHAGYTYNESAVEFIIIFRRKLDNAALSVLRTDTEYGLKG